MNGIRRGFLLCVILMLLLLPLIPAGCSRMGPERVIEQFYSLWAEQDYPAMYGLIDGASQEIYAEELFVERYGNISRGIGLQGLEIEELVKRESSANLVIFDCEVRLETSTVGEIPVNYSIELSREKRGAPWLLQWNPALILPELDDNRRVDLTRLDPQRGVMTDRKGRILAGPGMFREVGAVPGRYEDEALFAAAVERLLGLSRETILNKLHQPWVKEGLYVPLAMLTPEQEGLVEGLLQIPGVMINEVERRIYPAGTAATHLTGYLGEITAEELAGSGETYSEGDLLGKSGLEAALEERLAGSKGYTLRILDGEGREVALIAKRELVQGEDIVLSIDLDLQLCAAEALGGRKGAVVALEPNSGELLALYSSPAFDPNRFIAGLSAAEWGELQGDPAQPFLNRALSGIYPPGSAFKPFTAAAAMAEGALDPAAWMEISGEQWQPSEAWGDYHVRRVHPELKRLDLNEAMKFSDNIYFARAGLALGAQKFLEYGERFGFGEEIAFPLPVARSRLARDGISSEIQLADSSYGQGEVMITPLQMALLYSAFAGGGAIPQPCLILPAGGVPWKEGLLDPEVVQTVHRALVETLHGARAPAAAGVVPGFTAAGKTGTAEVDQGEGNVCWYATYAPAESPGIVVAVVIEGGGWAGSDALPVGRALLERYLSGGGEETVPGD